MILDSESTTLLREAGVDVLGLLEIAELVFQSDEAGLEFERELDLDEFMKVVMSLRGGNAATVKDIVDLRKFLHKKNSLQNATIERMEDRMRYMELRLHNLAKALNIQTTSPVKNPPLSPKLGNEDVWQETDSRKDDEWKNLVENPVAIDPPNPPREEDKYEPQTAPLKLEDLQGHLLALQKYHRAADARQARAQQELRVAEEEQRLARRELDLLSNYLAATVPAPPAALGPPPMPRELS